MAGLANAIKTEQWELASYYLLVALAQLADRVPAETLADLLEFLAEGDDDASA